MEDPEKGARTIAEIHKFAETKRKQLINMAV